MTDYAELRRWLDAEKPMPLREVVMTLLGERDRLEEQSTRFELSVYRLAAALADLIPGYEQYLEWCRERGVFFVKNGDDLLQSARAALAPETPR